MGIFQGELMVCVQCGLQQRSHPEIQSGWYKVVADGVPSNLCPKCMGAPAPKCQSCQKFYHEDYGANCPWCGHTQSKQSSSKGFGRQR